MNYLYSVVLELSPVSTTTIPATMGHQTHAMFLNLIREVDPVLSARLHEEQNYRPFTVSQLRGGQVRGKDLSLQAGQLCYVRITLLDGGRLWQCLSTRFLEAGQITLRLDTAEFALHKMLSTPASDPTGWAGFTDWQALATTTARRNITLHFASPTAFNLGDRHFALFPEPSLVWDSLMRAWNLYAPTVLHLDKASLREFITKQVIVNDYQLQTATLNYPSHIQKGFTGSCTYLVREEGECAAQVAALAEFARYSGIGHKTTMGMGQARTQYIENASRILNLP